MDTPPNTPLRHERAQRRALVRLAAVALRRTAFENSTHLLAAGTTVLLLADGARRVTTPGALDRWLVAAIAATVVLPVVLAGTDPLRSVRMALLPVPTRVLARARTMASAPLRVPFAAWLAIAGTVPTAHVASRAAVPALIAWSVAAFFAGAVLEAQWNRPRAVVVRALTFGMAAIGASCWWSLRGTPESNTLGALAAWVPALLPREGSPASALTALTPLVASVALGAVALRAPGRPAHGRTSRARLESAAPASRSRWVPIIRAASFPSWVRPSVAREIALLTRHVGSRVALGVVALLAGAATYGRVPGLALAAIVPMMLLAANALGADAPLGGLLRHQLQPESFTAVRDRRLTVWAMAAACAATLGIAAGVALPPPRSVGQPVAGVFGAPVMLLFAINLIPWFGRASWWWARRYPQPLARRVSDMGAPRADVPAGPAHLALGLLATWTGVALLAGLLWSATHTLVRALVHGLVPAAGFAAIVGNGPASALDRGAWIGAALLAGGVAAGAHLALSTVPLAGATSRGAAGAEVAR